MLGREAIRTNNTDIRWSYKQALLAFVLSFVLSQIITWLCRNVVPTYIDSFIINPWARAHKYIGVTLLLIFVALPDLIHGGFSLLLVYFFVVVKSKNLLTDLGFGKEQLFKNIIIGIFVGITIALFYNILFSFVASYVETGTPTIKYLRLYTDSPLIINEILFDGIFAGFWQEVFFVSFIYVAFRKKAGRLIGFLVTFCLFTLFHISNERFVIQIPIYLIHTIITILLFERRKSIIPSICFHAISNIFM